MCMCVCVSVCFHRETEVIVDHGVCQALPGQLAQLELRSVNRRFFMSGSCMCSLQVGGK